MRKIIYALLTLLTITYLYSCKDMDGTYEEFIVPNGLKYPQKPDSLKVFAGYNKLRLSWLKPNDPSTSYAMVYWNNYHDSLRVEIDSNQDTIFVDVDNIGEVTLTFYVKTFDNQGNASIPSEVTGTSYGDNYLMGATDRTILSALRDAEFNGTITWNNKTKDLIYTEVRYRTNLGETKTAQISPDKKTLVLPDIKPGEFFEYRSVFLPPKGVDEVAREWKTSDKPFLYMYPRTTWTAEARNGNHPWGEMGGEPFRTLNGDLNTGWHSRVGTPLPQVLVVDMKEQLPVDNVIIYPPGPVNWRYMNNVEIYVSETPITPDAPQPSWGSPAAKILYLGEYPFVINFPAPKTGQYIAVVFLDSKTAPNSYISFMELEVYGY